jgi:hypothetical protein
MTRAGFFPISNADKHSCYAGKYQWIHNKKGLKMEPAGFLPLCTIDQGELQLGEVTYEMVRTRVAGHCGPPGAGFI